MQLKNLNKADPLFAKYTELAPDWAAILNNKPVKDKDGTIKYRAYPLTDSFKATTMALNYTKYLKPVINAARVILPYKDDGKIKFADISEIVTEKDVHPQSQMAEVTVDPDKIKAIYQYLNKQYGMTEFYAPSFAIPVVDEDPARRFGFTLVEYEETIGLKKVGAGDETAPTDFWYKDPKAHEVTRLGNDEMKFSAWFNQSIELERM